MNLKIKNPQCFSQICLQSKQGHLKCKKRKKKKGREEGRKEEEGEKKITERLMQLCYSFTWNINRRKPWNDFSSQKRFSTWRSIPALSARWAIVDRFAYMGWRDPLKPYPGLTCYGFCWLKMNLSPACINVNISGAWLMASFAQPCRSQAWLPWPGMVLPRWQGLREGRAVGGGWTWMPPFILSSPWAK